MTIDLLIKWLVHYKFKNWVTHKSTGNPVTQQEKEKRAKEIAAELGDNNKWKSHARPINIEELNELKLKIEDYWILLIKVFRTPCSKQRKRLIVKSFLLWKNQLLISMRW